MFSAVSWRLLVPCTRHFLLAWCLCSFVANGQGTPGRPVNANTDALVHEAERHRSAGESVVAEDLLRKALDADPQSVAANNALGNLFLDRRRWPDAMERFEAVLQLDIRNAEARGGEEKAAVALALHYRAAGDADSCLKTLEHASSQIPGDALLLTDLGIQAQSMGKLKAAKDALTTALAAAPESLTAIYALGRVEMDLQDFSAAQREFQVYLRQRPNDATAHYGLGRVYQMEQRTDDAAQEFQKSIRLQPDQAESLYQLGQMALDANRDDEARADFDKVVDRIPSHGGALTGLGILSYRTKDYPGAERWLARAVTVSPDYQPAHYYLGLTLRRLGRQQDADRELHLATELASKQQGKGAPVTAP